MAARAAHFSRQVRGTANVHFAQIPGMADQAAVLRCAGAELGKPHDLLLVCGNGVQPSGTMAALTAGSLRRLIADSNGIEVSGAPELIRDPGMASLADLGADERVRGGNWLLRKAARKPGDSDQRYQQDRSESTHCWPARCRDKNPHSRQANDTLLARPGIGSRPSVMRADGRKRTVLEQYHGSARQPACCSACAT